MSELTAAHLRAIASQSAKDWIVDGIAGLAPTMLPTYGLNKPHRLAHFLAQIAHESARFATTEEYASGAAYEGRRDLGNTQPGDGRRFKGRGLIQVTGRYNVTKFRDWCRVNNIEVPDFVADSEALEQFPWALLSACWFWDFGNSTGRTLNVYSDENNTEAITRKINGGLNGYEDRLTLYSRSALVLLGYTLGYKTVEQFQRDVGFSEKDIDDIAGPKTRDAMHTRLAQQPEMWKDTIPVDPLEEIRLRLLKIENRLTVLESNEIIRILPR